MKELKFTLKRTGKLVKKGNIYLSLILIFCSTGLLFYPIQQTLNCEARILSDDSTVLIKTDKSGLFEVYELKSNEVEKGMVLGILNSDSNYEDVHLIKNQLIDDNFEILSLDELYTVLPSTIILGNSLSEAYINYKSAYGQYIIASLTPKNRLIDQRISNNYRLQRSSEIKANAQLQNLLEQVKIREKQKNDYKRLYDKGTISKNEYSAVLQSYYEVSQKLNEKINSLDFDSENLNSEVVSHKLNKIEESRINMTLFYQLSNAKQTLFSAISSWEDEYLIKAPASGYLKQIDFSSKLRNVEKGEVLFYIEDKPLKSIARLRLPQHGSGMVKIGQNVVLHLDNYPSYMFGQLKGKITSIGEAPNQLESEEYYNVTVSIDSLITSNYKELKYKTGMRGEAVVILDRFSFAKKLINSIGDGF